MLRTRTKQTYTAQVEMDGHIVASVDVPCRRALAYLIEHPRSKYTKDLKRQMLSNGCTMGQIAFVLQLEPEDSDEALDLLMDAEDAADGSHYTDCYPA